MASRVVGSFERVIAELGVIGGRIRRGVNDQIQKEAEKIRDIAIQMVPVEDGDMEKAIKVYSSDFRRRFTVSIDDDAPAIKIQTNGVIRYYTVGEYAAWLHESYYNLGPKSEAKNAGSLYRVDRKFLERAWEERRDKALRNIRDAARRAGNL